MSQEERPSNDDFSTLPPPPLAIRLLFAAIGLLLVLVGIAGLALPGIQGILTIAIGAGVLSIASRTVHRLLDRLLIRWPKLRDRVNRARRRVHEKFAPRGRDR